MNQATEHKDDSPQLEAEDIYLRSEELQEVLGRPPGWVVRSGMLLIALFFLLVAIAAYFVRSYDMVPCPVSITTQTLPASVEARQTGKISHLFVTENQAVKAGTHLAVIQSTCNYEDLQEVSLWLHDFHTTFNKGQVANAYVSKGRLGALEPTYTQLQNTIEAYHFFESKAFYIQQQQQLKSQIEGQQALQQTVSQKETLIRERLALTEQIRKGERSLFEKEMLSQKDNADAEKILIEEQLQLTQSEQEQARIQIDINRLQQRIEELKQLQVNENQKLLEDIRSAMSDFVSAVDSWEEQYVLRAPIAGKVSFFQFWSANQEVNQGDEVMVIIPPDQDVLAYAYLPVSNAGKVEKGQAVRMEMADFPAQEYGYVWGRVSSKSEMARNGAYLLKIQLDKGLETKQGEALRFSQEMSGLAQVIIRDENLLQRLFRTLGDQYDRLRDRTSKRL